MKQSEVTNASRLMLFGKAEDTQVTYGRRTTWVPENDSGATANPRGAVAFRLGGKTLVSTCGGNVRQLPRDNLEDRTCWSIKPC